MKLQKKSFSKSRKTFYNANGGIKITHLQFCRIIDYIKTEYKVTVPRHKVDNAIIRNEKLLIYGEEIPNLSGICTEYINYEARQLADEFSSKAAAAGVQLPDIGLLILWYFSNSKHAGGRPG